MILSLFNSLPGTGVRKGVKTTTVKTVTVKYPSGEEETLPVAVVQMTGDSAVALMTTELHAGVVTTTVDPDGASMTTAGPGEASTMTESPGEMKTAGRGAEWMKIVDPDEVMTTVSPDEALMTTAGPAEAWMNLDLDVGQMMTGAPEEEGMMRGVAAEVWMILAHVVEMTQNHGNHWEDQVQLPKCFT